MFASSLKDMMKDTDEQSDEETDKVRSGRSQDRSFCPRGVGLNHTPGVDIFTNLEAL